MQYAANTEKKKQTSFSTYQYFLWRKHDNEKIFEGFYPEILSTDGTRVRRMMSHHKQIIYQDFEDTISASSIVERIESSVTPGVTLVGYTMFKKYRSIAILQTSKNTNSPGWLAFPYRSHTIDDTGEPTVSIKTIMHYPKLRLVAGAGISWKGGKLLIHAALEQRGAKFLENRPAFSLFDFMESWEIVTIAFKGGEEKKMEVAISPLPMTPFQRATDSRAEATFVLEPNVYKTFRKMDNQIWFKLRFKRELFCLPNEWCDFWIQVDLREPPNLLM